MFIAPCSFRLSLRQERHVADLSYMALLRSAKHVRSEAINMWLLRSQNLLFKQTGYSYLSATSGSTFVARRAGM